MTSYREGKKLSMPRAGCIIVGDELLSGRIHDQNSPYLAHQLLHSRDITLGNILTVGDDKKAIGEAIDLMINKYDLIFISGGLGPTPDDKTKEALADFFQRPLTENEQAKKILGTTRHSYHLLPKGAWPIHNPQGSAPGIKIKHQNTHIFALPGVPHEFQAMAQTILQNLDGPKDPTRRRQIVIKTALIHEEQIFHQKMPELWKKLSSLGTISSLPVDVGVDIIISFRSDEKEAQEKKHHIHKLLAHSPIKDLIWSYEENKLEELIVKKAQEKNYSFSFAESCTGGLAASRITDVSGSSQVFSGSFITYSNKLKKNILHVKEETLAQWGAVSVQVANEMASGARKHSQADLAVSFSGIAGPNGGSQEKPVGTVAISVATPKETKGHRYLFQGDRQTLKRCFSQAGLFLLLKAIEELHS